MDTYLLGSALKIMIYASIEVRERHPDWFDKEKVDENFLRDYCSVHMRTSRRTGHSHAIYEAARIFKNPIFLFPSERQAMDNIQIYPKDRFRSAGSHLRGIDCDSIFVDCGFALSDKQRNNVEDLALGNLPLHRNTFCLAYVGY